MADVLVGQKRRDPHDGRIWDVHNIREADSCVIVTLQRRGHDSLERMPLPRSLVEEMDLVEGGNDGSGV